MSQRSTSVLCGLTLATLVWTSAGQDRRASKKGPVAPAASEAPAGFDNKSNGFVDDTTHQADQVKFDEVEGIPDGLGPLYNAQSCRECHQNPSSGGGSQVAE